MIIIIDYGMGNFGSILNMLKRIGVNAEISDDPHKIMTADKLILPGIGAFDHGMENLHRRGLIEVLNKHVLEHKCPILGICLGMQLFSNKSEEGQMEGLHWIPAMTKKFIFNDLDRKLKIPHMGWNIVIPKHKNTLFAEFDLPPRFYFVHSYHVCCENKEDILGLSIHGYEFVAAVQRDNIMGTQFHPEKSHRYGLQLLKSYAEL